MSLIKNLLVIDSQVTNWQDLAAAATPDTTVLILDPATDGLSQISAYLSSLIAASAQTFTPLQSIQIISHGSAGSISLGSTSITTSTLKQYTSQLATLGSALTATGDILLYGCNVAAEQIGLDFINQFAALTSADVAASTDLTGATALGGNWVLEAATGVIEAPLLVANTYAYTLDVITGTPVADTLTGTGLDDTINGGDGDDTIDGQAGSDTIHGDAGNDTIDGNFGNDFLYGDLGDDTLRDDQGSNYLDGGEGNDNLRAQSLAGIQDMHGGLGIDTLTATGKTVALYGDDGNDSLTANGIIYTNFTNSYVQQGIATLYGGTGNDGLNASYQSSATLNGEDGNDSLRVEYSKSAILNGGTGMDTLYAYFHGGYSLSIGETYGINYTLNGGADDDTLTANGSAYSFYGLVDITLDGGTGNDTLTLSDSAASYNNGAVRSALLSGGDGNDRLTASGVLELTLTGGTGTDTFALTALQYQTSQKVSIQFTTQQGTPANNYNYGYITVAAKPTDITDFTAGAGGDLLDIRDLLQNAATGYDGTNPFAAGYLQFEQLGTNTLLKFDADGATNLTLGFVTIATLSNVTANQLTLDNFYPTFGSPVTPNNIAPTFTAFSNTVASGNEDSQITISFADLILQGNQADSDGTIASFVIKNLSSGTLKIGTSASTAAEWNVNTNYTVNAIYQAYWTPDANANGTLNAFTAVAKDNGGLESATPVQASVAVTAVNDIPTFSTLLSSVASGNEDSQIAISFADLLFQGNEADIDGTVAGFVIKVLSTGTLKIGASAGTANPWNVLTNNTVDATNQAYWTPAANANGTLNAFTVVAKDDGGAESATAIQATVAITALNDAPTLTAFASTVARGAKNSQITVTFADLKAQGNEADVDGTVDSFVIKGITDGTLSIGTSASLATAYNALTNNTIDATHQAYWTPAINTSTSPINAFTVVAKDNTGLESLNPIQAAITIADFTPNTAPSFAVGGKTITDLGGIDIGRSVAVQDDGKILVGGTTGSDFALVRYNPDGTLDTSFNSTGSVITDLANLSLDTGYSITIQDDGKILLGGTSGSNFALVRYNNDGTLDTTFNSTGIVSINPSPTMVGFYGSGSGVAQSVVVQADGKILLGGTSRDNYGNSHFSLVRLNVNGTLDTSFDSDGIVNAGNASKGYSISIQADGKILLGGTSIVGFESNTLGLVRFNIDGSLDTSFDVDGMVVSNINYWGFESGNSVALQTDHKILLAGSYYDYESGANGFIISRFNDNGSLDTSFNGTGKVYSQLSFSGTCYSVIVQADGKILLGGTSGEDFALIRYYANGLLDTSFGNGGITITDLGNLSADTGYSVTVLADGKILLAGTSNNDFALARFNADGTLDNTFSTPKNTLDNSPVYTESRYDWGNSAVILDANVQIIDPELAAINNYNGATLTLARHGGANSQDVFSSSYGTLTPLYVGSYFAVDGITIGRVTTNDLGILTLSFNAKATQALVSKAMQQIAYANTADAPPATVQIDWTFNDGNTGSQGTGGALSVIGSTIITIVATNDRPVLVELLIDQTLFAGNLFNYSLPSDSFTDPDGDVLSYQVTMADGTGTPPWLSFDAATRTFSGTPDQGDIGSWNLLVTATDPALTSAITSFVVTVSAPDNTAPTVTSFSPVDNAIGVKASANVILTFSEPIQKGTGTIQIHTGSAAGPVFESVAVASGNTLTIDPTVTLSPSTHYFVTLDAGSVNDLAGNAYVGISSYDFTTAAAPFNVNENVTFWKTGLALSGATSSLVATNTVPPVEFRNLQIAADGSRSFEIWETSTGTNSLQLKVALPDGAFSTWQDAAGLPSGWSSLANTELSGQLSLGGIGLTALADGPVKLGTLTMHSPNPFTSFDLSLITGSLGTQTVAPFSITPDITNLSTNELYQHVDIAGGSYQLNTAKSALSIGNAIQANDALATLKMAVGLTPNIDSSAASPFQFLAADVNRDGKVSAADALNVLKMALDLSTAPEKNWFFMPDVVANESMTRTTVNWSGTVNPLIVDHTQTVHLIGVVSGDVNGSWVEPVIV